MLLEKNKKRSALRVNLMDKGCSWTSFFRGNNRFKFARMIKITS